MAKLESYLLLSVMLVISASGSPVLHNTQGEDLTSELEKIKSLLEELEEGRGEVADVESRPPPPLRKITEEEHAVIEPMKLDDGAHTEDTETAPEMAGLLDTEAEASITWRDIVKTLRQMKDEKLFIPKSEGEEDSQQETSPDEVDVNTDEGKFGQFRDEIKYSIEKNLLSDVALAVHSGIKMEEILADLMGTATIK